MALSTRLFVFGDQTAPIVPKLRELLAVRDLPILNAFLEQSHYVLRAQIIQSLPPHEHKPQRTASLAELVQRYDEGVVSPAFQTALSCLCNLGLFIRCVSIKTSFGSTDMISQGGRITDSGLSSP